MYNRRVSDRESENLRQRQVPRSSRHGPLDLAPQGATAPFAPVNRGLPKVICIVKLHVSA